MKINEEFGNAIDNNNTGKIKKIINQNIDLNEVIKHGEHPLHHAIRDDEKEIARLFIELGSDINASNNYMNSLLHYCCVFEQEEIAKLLIDRGADINALNEDDHSILVFAVIWNCLDIVKNLINKSIDINRTNDEIMDTPLHCAARGKNTETVKLLLANGADKSAKNYYGDTPLDIAIEEGASQIAEILKNY